MAIKKYGSINAAAKSLNMSYRAAWGRLRASEERMGIHLVESSVRGKTMQLTPKARAIIKRFEKLEKDVERLLQAADEDFQSLLE